MIPKSFLDVVVLVCLLVTVLAGLEDTESSSTIAHVSQINDVGWSSLSSSVISAVKVESKSSHGEGEDTSSTETLQEGESVGSYVFRDVKDRQKHRKLEEKEKNELDTSKEDEDDFLNPEEFLESIEQCTENRGDIDEENHNTNPSESSEKNITRDKEPEKSVAEKGCKYKGQDSKIGENPAETGVVTQSVPNIRRQGDIRPHSTLEPNKVEFDDQRYDQTPPISPPPPPPYPPQNSYDGRIRNGQQGPRSDHGEPQLLLTYGGYQRPFQETGPRFQETYSPRPSGQSPFATTNTVVGSRRPFNPRVLPQGYYEPPNSHQSDQEYQLETPFQSPFRSPTISFDEPRFIPGPPSVTFGPVQQSSRAPFQGFQNDVRSGYQNALQSPILESSVPQFQGGPASDFFNRPPSRNFPSFVFRDIPTGGFPPASDHQVGDRFVEFRGPPTVEQRPFGSQQQSSNLSVSHQYPAEETGGVVERPNFRPFGNSESSPSVDVSFRSSPFPFFGNSRPDLPVGPPSNFFASFSNGAQPFNVFTGYRSTAQNQNNIAENTAPGVQKGPQDQSEEIESVPEKQEPKQEQKFHDPEENQKIVREAPFGSRLTPTVPSGDNPFYIPSLHQVGYNSHGESPSLNNTSSEEIGNTKPETPSLFTVRNVFPGSRQQHSPPSRGNSFPSQGDKPPFSQLSSIRGPFQETSDYRNSGPPERNISVSVPSFFGRVPFQTSYDRPLLPSPTHSDNLDSGRSQFLRNPLPDRIFSSPLASRPTFGGNELRPTSPESVRSRNNGYHYFGAGNPREQTPNAQDGNAVPLCAQKANVSICFEDTVYPRNEILHSVDIDRYLTDRLLVSPGQTSRSSLVEGSEEIGDSDETEDYVCKSLVKYGRPKRAKNSEGQWKILVNLEDDVAGGRLSQPVRLEVCGMPGAGCSHTSNNVATQCVQKYNFHRLLVWTPGRGLSMDVFKLPVACSCQVNTKN